MMAAKKKTTRSKKVVSISRKRGRCSEVMNVGGKFYRCTRTIHGNNGDCEFAAPKPRKVSYEELFLQALTEFYSDSIAPSLTTAWLSDKSAWYASVVRYPAGTTKSVACAYTSGTSLADAKRGAVARWRDIASAPAKAALRRFMQTSGVAWDDSENF
jgi:hypothetical protein